MKEENMGIRPEQMKRRKIILIVVISLIAAVCAVGFLANKKDDPEVHAYEEIKDITQRAEISYENLIFCYGMHIGNGYGQADYRHLGIFNTGEVYCFRWTGKDSNYEAVYLGRLSRQDSRQLNEYVNRFDKENSSYWTRENMLEIDDGIPAVTNGNAYQDLYRSCGACIYIHDNGTYKCVEIEYAKFYFWDDGENEKIEIRRKRYEENAVAIIDWFDESWFREKFIEMCLSGY